MQHSLHRLSSLEPAPPTKSLWKQSALISNIGIRSLLKFKIPSRPPSSATVITEVESEASAGSAAVVSETLMTWRRRAKVEAGGEAAEVGEVLVQVGDENHALASVGGAQSISPQIGKDDRSNVSLPCGESQLSSLCCLSLSPVISSCIKLHFLCHNVSL